MFTRGAHKVSLNQSQGLNNNFFEESTLALMQKLSEMAQGRQEDIKTWLWKG
jgi:hypothetical protein